MINNYKLWTALITPLNEDGSVNYDELTLLLKQQEEARNGILILGSTGEALNLSLDEKKKIIEHTLKLELEVPIMCGVGGINIDTTNDWVDHLNSKNIDCYLLVTPLYAKPGEEGQTHWFKTLLDKATKPCMLYNIPGRTGISLNVNTVKTLATHKNFWSIKEASGSVDDFKNYVEAANGKPVYSGDDPMLPAYVPVGAKGLVSVASNVWPKQTNLYTQLALKNELQSPHPWKESSEALFCASNPVPAKVLLKELGIISSAKTKAPLSEKDLKNNNLILEANKNINDWFNSRK